MGLFGFIKDSRKDDEGHSSTGALADGGSVSAEDAAQQKLLTEEKKDMIRGVEDLSQTTVKEVMIPRIDVDFLSVGTDAEELLQKITESGHSRFPVYSSSIDNVVYFVPESKRIDSLLREFKRRHVHIAIAIDEYGGISGIVCMEDIIEQIVGDIQDEFDNEREDILPLGDNVWLCDARVDLDDLNETIGADFPSNDFDTLGGFVFDLFGKIPVKFEKVSWHDWDFIVQEMEGHKVDVIKVVYHKVQEKNTDE